ncbi:MAG: 30S ribosomal protein S1 [Candidatus Brennerbacteria bacterium CG11_big_fil_rev_8_21_14_0_20_43_10]|uniref:30S ribosomal protein S1 n=2 Tax=Candidatus Brenneribacteriota TaxID=1817902 RepID=A0A2H9N459_9BACT|nr:MAG: 30S ribosomal protein S1 [Candidatus Brennerbacteria bacterium CG11_big_fil_rev_8_21_14_0_20_43_10]PIX28570.1 MAG: 30S ribosomal protein S1 [Candidatus Brennerbacteria bacterium CG_4_8_14_3_um_filter_43_14]
MHVFDTLKKTIPAIGEILTGNVIRKESRRVFVDLDTIGTGVVLGKEYFSALNKIRALNIGNEVTVKIVEIMNDEGFWELSMNQADREAGWEKLRELKDKREILSIPVLGANHGGLLIQLEGIEGFLPVSQLSLEHYPRVEGGDKTKILDELRKFIKKEINVRILDVSEREEKLIFSEREAEEEKMQGILAQYKIGDSIDGEITGIANFGAFIKFGNPPLEGLIHISEIDYKMIDDPAKYVRVGEIVKAKIVNITNGRVFLSLKALKENPWDSVETKYQKGSVYEGKVIKINPIGAFVMFEYAIYGICPIAQFADDLETLKNAFIVGETYSFTVADIDQQEKHLILNLKK